MDPAVTPFTADVDWTLPAGDGEKAVAVQYGDAAGNWSGNCAASITLDTTGPVVTITAPLAGHYYQTAPPLAYTVSDNLDPSPAVLTSGYGTAEGVHTVTVTATDWAGNVASAAATYTVDSTAPAVTITAPLDGHYYQTAPPLAYTVSDNLDPSPAVLTSGYGTAEGVHTVTVTATDWAGNVASAAATYTVDSTAPVITITAPVDGFKYLLNQVVLASYGATDNLSGVAALSGTVADGSPIDTSTVGAKTFSVTATDNAGNSAMTCTYYVECAFGGFLPPIKATGQPAVFSTRQNRTIPVKFVLTDANGALVGGLTSIGAPVFAKVAGVGSLPPADWTVGESTSAADRTRFRWTGTEYVFNLDTKNCEPGVYLLQVTLPDGNSHRVYITLVR